MSNVIPKIKSEKESGRTIKLPEAIRIYSAFEEPVIKVYAERMAKKGFEVSPVEKADDAFIEVCRLEEEANKEKYTISVTETGVAVGAASARAAIYAFTTLYLLMENGRIPETEIEDEPKYAHRGQHMDVARHFQTYEEILKVIDELSMVKINVVHLHLADDQGWRIQVDKYPGLYEQCGDKYYTKDQLKAIDEYACERGIEVIPEIDMPGHTRAMTAAYPELSCSKEKVELVSYGGIFPVILCPGQEETYTFVTEMLDEVAPLFKGPRFHIGGDEAPKNHWKTCPVCQAKMQAEGLENEDQLQGYFTKRIADHLKTKHGKDYICWNDSLKAPSFIKGGTVQYWSLEHKANLPAFTEDGGSFIYSDMFDIYYDYPAAMSPMKRSYTCKPVIGGVDYSENPAMLGFEAALWTEYVEDAKTFENRMFPRIYALAENAWCGGAEENYADFNKRLDAYKKESAVDWGYGDPTGLKKMTEKMGYMKTMATGMPKEVKASTVESAAMSDEFMALFKEKMMK